MTDPTNPAHYRGFSRGAEVIDITENLTGNGAQAVQYVARSCRLDGNNKGDQIEDLDKAIWFLQRERERLEHTQFVTNDHTFTVGDVEQLREKTTATEPAAPGVVVGGWYQLADGVDRLGVPIDTEWVMVEGFPVAHGAGKVRVSWPHIKAGPLHQSAIIPRDHLTGDAHTEPGDEP